MRDARHSRAWRERIVPRILRRDGGICHLCGQPGADTADHLVPVAQGGTHTPSNLRAAHQTCNRKRGDRPIDQARNEILRTNDSSDWTW